MDRNRNEDINPEDADLAGVGQERGRDSDKLAPNRTENSTQHGRDGFKGRAGEGNTRAGNQSGQGERTDDLYPAMKRRSSGDAAHVPDTSGDLPSGSGEAAKLHDKDQEQR